MSPARIRPDTANGVDSAQNDVQHSLSFGVSTDDHRMHEVVASMESDDSKSSNHSGNDDGLNIDYKIATNVLKLWEITFHAEFMENLATTCKQKMEEKEEKEKVDDKLPSKQTSRAETWYFR